MEKNPQQSKPDEVAKDVTQVSKQQASAEEQKTNPQNNSVAEESKTVSELKMNEVIKNTATGLYNLQIGNSVFESKVANRFKTDSKEIENVLIESLPLNVCIDIEVAQNLYVELIRVTEDVIEVTIYEPWDWDQSRWFSLFFYYVLMEEIIQASIIKDSIELDYIFLHGDYYQYTFRFSAPTIGMAVQHAMEIYNSFQEKINLIGEQGANYMRYLANNVDASNIFSEKDKNTTV